MVTRYCPMPGHRELQPACQCSKHGGVTLNNVYRVKIIFKQKEMENITEDKNAINNRENEH